jgi:adenylate/nucleoside-diphosphate kinase
MIKLQDKLPV